MESITERERRQIEDFTTNLEVRLERLKSTTAIQNDMADYETLNELDQFGLIDQLIAPPPHQSHNTAIIDEILDNIIDVRESPIDIADDRANRSIDEPFVNETINALINTAIEQPITLIENHEHFDKNETIPLDNESSKAHEVTVKVIDDTSVIECNNTQSEVAATQSNDQVTMDDVVISSEPITLDVQVIEDHIVNEDCLTDGIDDPVAHHDLSINLTIDQEAVDNLSAKICPTAESLKSTTPRSPKTLILKDPFTTNTDVEKLSEHSVDSTKIDDPVAHHELFTNVAIEQEAVVPDVINNLSANISPAAESLKSTTPRSLEMLVMKDPLTINTDVEKLSRHSADFIMDEDAEPSDIVSVTSSCSIHIFGNDSTPVSTPVSMLHDIVSRNNVDIKYAQNLDITTDSSPKREYRSPSSSSNSSSSQSSSSSSSTGCSSQFLDPDKITDTSIPDLLKLDDLQSDVD